MEAAAAESRIEVHPHVRGDNTAVSPADVSTSGPPPRAWGQPIDAVVGVATERSTPTCVGTTRARRSTHMALEVHPHVRGDNEAVMPPCPDRHGPPPRAWGQRAAGDANEPRSRSTPTCVGTTRWPASPATGRTVHPHVRGDNATLGAAPAGSAGPPPRAWGQHLDHDQVHPPFRSTPTCVGTTRRGGCARRTPAVHPHVRGDNCGTKCSPCCRIGPPPRAWGQRHRSSQLGFPRRSTPTCVGTTCPVLPARPGPEVHPHVRGDNRACARPGMMPSGPPPRAWGQQ